MERILVSVGCLGLTLPLFLLQKMVLCQENGHVKQREIAELRQLLFSG
jgi:hypothetical protein